MLKSPHALSAYMPRWASTTTNGDRVAASHLSSRLVSVNWPTDAIALKLRSAVWNPIPPLPHQTEGVRPVWFPSEAAHA